MIYKGKRIPCVQIYKEKRVKRYFVVTETSAIERQDGLIFDDCFGPITNVDADDPRPAAKDLKERAGISLLSPRQILAKRLMAEFNPVGWNKVPEGWQKIFKPHLERRLKDAILN